MTSETPMTHTHHRATRVGTGRAVVLLLLASGGLAMALGAVELADAPPIADIGSWPDWALGRHPLDVTAGVVRLVLLLPLGYLALIAGAHLLVAATPGRRMRAVVERATPRLLAALLAGSLLGTAPAAGAGATGPSSSPADVEPGAGAVMQVIEPTERRAGSDPAPQTHLPWAARPDRLTVAIPPGPSTSSSAEPAASLLATRAPQVRAVHTVATGDHLWGIAEQHLRAHDVEDSATLVRYWQQLIEANRDRLVDPENPDLIHPGQQLELPPLP